MPTPRAGRAQRADRTALALVALLLLTLLAYLPVFRNGFVEWDDPAYVTENSHVRGGLTPAGIVWAFRSLENANWHPLTWLSHMTDVSLYGLAPAGHHATSLLLHLLNTWLLYSALRSLTRTTWRSLAVAALFALHPLHVESVAWISERKDVLCTAFALLSIWAYARYAHRPAVQSYLWVALTLALGLMAKAMLVSLPLVLLLLDVWPLDRMRFSEPRLMWARIAEKLPLLALVLAASLVALLTQGRGGALTETTLAARVAQAMIGYTSYLQHTFWPVGLTAFYPYRPDPPLLEVGCRVLTLLLITAGAVWSARRRPYLIVGWLWYVVTLLPVIGIVRIGQQEMADRYTYIPLIGVFIMLVWGVGEWIDASGRAAMRPRIAAALTGLVLASCAAATTRQVTTWHDGVSLWTRAIAIGGTNAVSVNNLGAALERAGRLDEAARRYDEAIALAPGNVRAHANLGNVRFAQGRYAEAARAYEDALRLQSDMPTALANLATSYYNIANAAWRAGRLDDALAAYANALRVRPDDAGFLRAQALAQLQAGRLDAARGSASRAVALAPSDAAAHDAYGLVLYALGDRAGAKRELAACRALNGVPTPALAQALEGTSR